MPKAKTIFDVDKARATIEKGRRAKWWRRTGTSHKNFKYVDARGSIIIRNKTDIARIKALVVPPAWKHVRINPSPGGKIQAVGMDGNGRVQYRYNSNFSEKQQRKKFQKIEEFGKLLPQLRQVTNEHVSLDGLPREKVLALIMRLINALYFRVGTDLSAEHYKTYGITTLQKKHLKIGNKGKLVFDFVGKSHVQHRKVIVDQELAAAVKELAALGRGRKLFRYLDADGKARAVTPAQINSYIKSATGPSFSSKDFRTWGGTVLAASEFAELGVAKNKSEIKKNIVQVVKRVAEELGNTPAVCRSSYIHPIVLSAYEAGMTIGDFRPRASRRITRKAVDLEPEEVALIKLLESQK